LDQLPARCHVAIPGLPLGANVAVCVSGRDGVRMTLDFGGTCQARTAVRVMNRVARVSTLAERAMLAGAMLGWHCVVTDGVSVGERDRRVDCGGRRGAASRAWH
jgi:hypothetical protein